ncbi:hypothetical protein MTO96_023001 [Rhipicephalus appendiculatus]
MWQHCVEARVNLDRAEDEDEDRSRLTCSTSGLFSKYRRDDVHMRDCVRGDHAGRLVHRIPRPCYSGHRTHEGLI